MAERKTEYYNDAQGRLQSRETFEQGQGKFKEALSTESEANAGTKRLFSKEEAPEKPKSEMSLGELQAYNRKKREEKAKEAGQKQALNGIR